MRKSFRRAMLKYHPDKGGDEDITKFLNNCKDYWEARNWRFGLIRGKKVRLHWDQGKRKFYFNKN